MKLTFTFIIVILFSIYEYLRRKKISRLGSQCIIMKNVYHVYESLPQNMLGRAGVTRGRVTRLVQIGHPLFYFLRLKNTLCRVKEFAQFSGSALFLLVLERL